MIRAKHLTRIAEVMAGNGKLDELDLTSLKLIAELKSYDELDELTFYEGEVERLIPSSEDQKLRKNLCHAAEDALLNLNHNNVSLYDLVDVIDILPLSFIGKLVDAGQKVLRSYEH